MSRMGVYVTGHCHYRHTHTHSGGTTKKTEVHQHTTNWIEIWKEPNIDMHLVFCVCVCMCGAKKLFSKILLLLVDDALQGWTHSGLTRLDSFDATKKNNTNNNFECRHHLSLFLSLSYDQVNCMRVYAYGDSIKPSDRMTCAIRISTADCVVAWTALTCPPRPLALNWCIL